MRWVFLACGIFWGSLFYGCAYAAPPINADPNSTESKWYRSLRQPFTGYGCCDQSDCRPVRAHFTKDGWEIEVNGFPMLVPEDKILYDREHPAGQAVACIVGGRVYCFVPPGAGG